jgi:hypothetical protein
MKKIIFAAVAFMACKGAGASWQHYRLSAFDEARNRNMPIYLHFYESGTATCEKQKLELEKIIENKKFVGVGAYRVSWNSEKALQKTFGVKDACTLLVFKGDTLKTKISSDVGQELLTIALEQAL